MSMDSAAASTATRAVDSDDLAQGLVLVQASAIKVVRLQLAMERRDRRAALETVDELMRLDRRISDFLDDLPISEDSVSAAREEVAAQGRALAREKFALAAGTNGPRLAAERAKWIDPQPAQAAAAAAVPVDPVCSEPELAAEILSEPRTVSPRLVAALLTLALAALVAAAFLFLTGSAPGLPDLLPECDGAL